MNITMKLQEDQWCGEEKFMDSETRELLNEIRREFCAEMRNVKQELKELSYDVNRIKIQSCSKNELDLTFMLDRSEEMNVWDMSESLLDNLEYNMKQTEIKFERQSKELSAKLELVRDALIKRFESSHE